MARVGNLSNAIKLLKKKGFWAIGADPEGSESVFDLDDRFFAAELLLILGAEGPGIREGVGRLLDHRVRIPLPWPGRLAERGQRRLRLLLFEAARRGRSSRPRETR